MEDHCLLESFDGEVNKGEDGADTYSVTAVHANAIRYKVQEVIFDDTVVKGFQRTAVFQ
jgi:hypothetical protein